MNFEEDTDRSGKEEADAVCMHEVPKEYFFKKINKSPPVTLVHDVV